MIDEPDAQASQERLTHVQIAQDASKPVSHDRLHEQAVAIYDLLDDNLSITKCSKNGVGE